MSILARGLGGLILMAVLSACATLPRGAALRSEVLQASSDAGADFAVYPVTRALLPSVQQWPLVGEAHLGWVSASQGSNAQVIAAGDTVTLTLWDNSENSLLIPTGQRQVVLTDMRVSPEGTIFVPYIGAVRIAGQTPSGARNRLQSAIEPVAATAQVQLSVAEGRGNSVDLVGGVGAPGIYPMPDRNFTVLSLIASGGGVSTGLENPQIRLQRGSAIYGTSVNRLLAEPALDTLLQPGDQVIVRGDDRYFLSVGATGSEARHTFPQDVVSAMDALSIIGGVNDSRANPKGVLILREYPASALSAGQRGPRQTRVVFAIDLTSADGLFSARNFRIAPKDLIYATESPVTTTQTIFALVGSAFGLATTVTN